MAFGRSNSLSINTGSGSSLFGNNQTTTTTQSGSTPMFGAPAAQPQQQQQTGGLFGNTASQPQQTGGLFGNNNATSQPQQTGGLFGNTTAQSQPQQTGSLFGNNNATPQPQQSGGLFGNANNTSNTQSTGIGGGLFSSSTQQSQPQQNGGGLFGGALGQNQSQQQGGAGLFGGLGQSQNQAQPQQNGGMFGVLDQNKPASTSLFGSSAAQQPGNNAQQQQQQQPAQQPSLFGTFVNPTGFTTVPLAGSLTMGQGNATNAPQNTVPGTKIDVSNLRPTTRFSDLHDDLKKQIQAMDAFIRQQEAFCAQCEAMVPVHATNIETIPPDVELITGKVETVELALENDSRGIEGAKALVKREAGDLMRCARVIENLTLPSAYHYGPPASRNRSAASGEDDGSYDVDLTRYFTRQAETMQNTLDTYTSHLAEIESHLRVIESGTIQQAQLLAAQRAGGRGATSQDTVRELADTLRGFENGILGAAGLVGSCREGVNDLILGKVSADARDGAGYGARRTVRF